MRQPPPLPPDGSPPGASFTRLCAVMEALLAPDGCPWDREQTLDSLKPFLVEETYEVLDALERGGPPEHCEELGDLLMQVVFQAAIRQAEGAFAIDDVVGDIVDKLVRRHPHVFGEVSGVETAGEVLTQWNQIKAAEKKARGDRGGVLAGVPRALPALMRAQQLGSKAGRVGFDWGGAEGSLAKVREEVEEVVETMGSGDKAAAHHEIGDLLFAVVNLARKLDVDAEAALHDASGRFTRRFGFIEAKLAEDDRTPEQSNLDEMDALWSQAKQSGL